MNTIFWHVKITDLPVVTHHCTTCGTKTPHVSSNSFRVNAHRKKLDVWLIYRCQICKTTWNCTIASRVSTKGFRADTLACYLDNDANLARQCAYNEHLLRKNGAEMQEPAFKVIGQNLNKGESAHVVVSCDHTASIRLSKVLRVKLGLSRRDFDDYASTGNIKLEGPGNLWKARMTSNHAVTIQGLAATPGETT